jgi:threonine dehydrogenase-like Zn-dependent dehydrogenase
MRYFGSAAVDPPVDGVFRKYLVLAESNCLELPPQVDFGMGALLEPLSVAIHALKRAGMIYDASM